LNKITKWRFKKNIQTGDAKKMRHIEEERRRKGKATAFHVCGREVIPERWERIKARKGFTEGDIMASSPQGEHLFEV
jgi:hypothetical protein